jgi:hypothetical protein
MFDDFLAKFTVEAILAALTDWNNPGDIVRNVTYALLILSVLMRDISWLRTFAIAAGTGRILFEDPGTAFWESILVAVNLTQLTLLWLANRKRNYSPATEQFLSTFDPRLSNAPAHELVRAGIWHEAPAGSMLTVQGESVNALLYVSSGTVRIEVNGNAVGSCSTGDFLGEMTWQSGNPATATAIAADTVKYLRFERKRLQHLLNRRAELKFALQTSFNRNLIEKLGRANDSNQAAVATAQA